LLVALENVDVKSAELLTFIRVVPRAAGIGLVAFMTLLALDAIVEGQTTIDTMRAFGMHLIPAGIVLLIVLVAWRRAWAGGVLFFALAVDGRVSWMLAISLPLVIEGVLFLWSARTGLRSA
jgi:uncharacterized protein YjeT (DUF2065 family)